METLKVFISYAWSTQDISDKVLAFSNRLRTEEGIDATIDQYEESPPEGWPIWMEKQIANSKFVLIIVDKIYHDKFNQITIGKGVTWEITHIYQHLYNMKGNNTKFIPVIFNDEDAQFVPIALQPYTLYNTSKNTEYLKLCNRLKGISNTLKPPVSNIGLPSKERKHVFITTPIDIDLWDRAKWKGVAFLWYPDDKGNLYNLNGLMFEGEESAAIQIFKEWQENKKLKDFVNFCFLEGDIEGLEKGYTCLIGPNVKAAVERAKSLGITWEELLLIPITRFQRMSPKDNFAMFHHFKDMAIKLKKPIPFCPVVKLDSAKPLALNNIKTCVDAIVYIDNVEFKNAQDIGEHDIESIAFPKYNKDFPKL